MRNKSASFQLCLLFGVVGIILIGCGQNPQVIMEKGFALYDAQNFSEALPLLEQASKGKIEDPELTVRLAYCYIRINNDPAKAMELLQQNALDFPNYPRTYYQLGFIAADYGDMENGKGLMQAVGFTRKAIELDSTDWRFKDNLGMFFLRLDMPDSAKYWFEQAYELHQDHPELNARLQQMDDLIAEKALRDSAIAADTLVLGK
ncbi:tetratricopeptide repeat protein [Calditrichota bacterium]